MQRHGDLEIRYDAEYHRRLFVFQRLGWAAIALFLIAALLGLIGVEGPLNSGWAGNDRLQVEYERFPHQESQTQIRITLHGSADGRLALWVDRGFLSDVRLQQVSPQPNEVVAQAGGVSYVFMGVRPDATISVGLLFEPEAAGRLRGEVRAGEAGAPVRFSQFVYP